MTAGAAFGENISLIIDSVAAIVLPFRRRNVYESSPAYIQIGPVPLLSIAGAISLVFLLTLQYYFISNPLYGANLPSVLLLVAVIILVGAPLYAVSY